MKHHINKTICKYILLAIILIACIPIVSATPPIPESYWGYATLNGVPAPDGTSITVEVYDTGEVVGTTTVQYQNGGYSLDIIFNDTDTAEDEGAEGEDALMWKINEINCSIPAPGTNNATSGGINGNFNLTATKISIYLDNTSAKSLFIGSANAPPNSTVIIPVSVANVTNLSGMFFNLFYNSSVVIVSSISANESFVGSNITPDINNANGIVNIVLSNSNNISASTETPVIDIVFNIIGGSGSSTYLDLQNVEFGDVNNTYTPEVVMDGMIKVGIKCDFNGNGRVDIGDVAKVAFMVAGNMPEDLNADFNGNGRVDIGDAAKIAFYLVGKVNGL